MFVWEMRYKNPRGLCDDVQIETFTQDEHEARELADVYLDTLSTPAVRLVYVRPACVARSTEFPALAAKWDPAQQPKPAATPVAKGKKAEKGGQDGPDRVPGRSGEFEPGPITDQTEPDGIDDEMSGPRVAKPQAAKPRTAPRGRIGA